MKVRRSLRSSWLSVKASYWFIPTLLTLFALALAYATIRIDHLWGPEWLSEFAWFERVRPDGARAQLTVIATAMIGIASTVFAITITAVAFASSNYGPRLLTNFMNDRGNQVSLGVFVSTFVYNLLVLRTVQSADAQPVPSEAGTTAAGAFVPQLSMLVSGVSVLIAVGVLVFFLHHVPASIRINTVLGGIGRRLIHDIEKRFPLEGGTDEPARSDKGLTVTARNVGYIEIIDFAELDEIAKQSERRFALAVRTGDFIHPHLPVLDVFGGPVDDDLAERILSCFSLGDSRTPTQDLEFLIDELVEIGLRALSPGVNDPFTAVASMHWLAAALAKLADRTLREGPEQQGYDIHRVTPVPDDFPHYLQRSFGGMRHAAAANPIAAKLFLDSLHGVALGATSAARKAALVEEMDLLVAQAEQTLTGPALASIQARSQYRHVLEDVGRSLR